MKLHFRKIGEGQPLVILHGLFGSSDNWQTLGKHFADKGFCVYLVDQRNHGRSPHSDDWNYHLMSNDLLELLDDEHIDRVAVIGHSMGGKTAMQFAIDHPERLNKLVVADIAPRKYNSTQRDVAEALQRVDLDSITSRKEAEEILNAGIDDTGTKQFLLKNLYWKEGEKERLAWRFNLEVIADKIELASDALDWNGVPCEADALFLRGEKSNYVREEDLARIKEIFPNSRVETIPGAGHWLHAEKPAEFFKAVVDFFG